MPDEGVDREKRATLRRFAALGAAGPLTQFADGQQVDEGSEPLPREAITGYLAATPGAHFSKLRDDLHLGTGETQYHLRRLVEEGTVESVRDGDYRRFFIAGEFDAFEQAALGYLRRDTPRGMVIELLQEPGATGADLADGLGVSRATVSNYAADLEERGLLARENGYSLERPEALLVLLIRYADSFGPEARKLAASAADLVSYDP